MLLTKAAQNVPRPNFLDCPAEFVDVTSSHQSVRVSYRSVAPSLCCLPTHWVAAPGRLLPQRLQAHRASRTVSMYLWHAFLCPWVIRCLQKTFYQQIKVIPWHRTNGESFPRQQATGLSQLYLPFAFSVPLKDQSWCEVPQERKREENKPSAQEFCDLFWATFMNFMSTMRKQSQVFFFSCRKKISWTSCQIPECLDQGSKQFGKKKAHRLQGHVWAIARIVPKMSVLLWPLHKLSWHVIATGISCPARLFYMLIPTFWGKLSSTY